MSNEQKDKDQKNPKKKGEIHPMWETKSKTPPDMIHVSHIADIMSASKITCRKCGATFGAYVFDEYVMHNRLICKECGWDNSQPYEGE
jgi:ribosomal protein L40E